MAEVNTAVLSLSCEDLASALSSRLEKDMQALAAQHAELETEKLHLEEKEKMLAETEQRIFAIFGDVDEIVELNVGGHYMSTTRGVLCSAEGSLLAGMFSGHFDQGHKRDKDGRIFLDMDPPLFAKILSHLRLRRISSPECPAPLPHVPEEMKPEFEMMVKYFGLDTFMFGAPGSGRNNIFTRLAELGNAEQSRLQSAGLLKIALSSTGGVPTANHEEVLSQAGFHERSLENSYGAHPNTINIKFLQHRVKVEGMELRAKIADVAAHMSNTWTFKHGNEVLDMQYLFSKSQPFTGRLPVDTLAFTDEVTWNFPADFCLEHIALFGWVTTKS